MTDAREIAPRDREAGLSIVLVVVTILLLLTLGLASVALVVEDAEIAATGVESSQALYVAQAGIEYAVRKLTVNPGWSGLPPPGKAVGAGSFSVAPPDSVDPDGRPLPPARRRLVSTGQVRSATRVLQVEVAPGAVTSLASPAGDPWTPEGLALAPAGDLYVADPIHHVVRRADLLTGLVSPAAGTGTPGSGGDGGRAEAATLRAPRGLCVTPDGDLYIADAGAHVVRRVSAATGAITTVAGTGTPGSGGDGGPATEARLNEPSAIAITPEGDLFIVERGGNRIRRILSLSAVITTVAGTGSPGYSGDNGPATAARLRAPEGVAVAANGDLYVADTGNHAIRRVARATGIITTIAGTGAPGSSGDGGPAAAAVLSSPRAIGIGPAGDLFLVDTGNHRVRRVEIGSGVITTVAGSGLPGFAGDGGPATIARLQAPSGIALTPSGVYFVADTGNRRVRRVAGVLAVVAWMESEG